MALKELLLAAIVQWAPPWYPPGKNPELPDQYRARLDTIAQAVAIEAAQVKKTRLDKRALAAATLVIWYGETRFSHGVHVKGVSRWGQDRGKARCMGQIHVSGLVPKKEWDLLVGGDLEATRRCARATLRVLAAQSRYCGVRRPTEAGIAKVISAYGTGKGCRTTDQGKKRARRWARLMKGI